jgi:hypothetical protein
MEYMLPDQDEYMLKSQNRRIICTSTNYNIFSYLLLPVLSVDLVWTMIFWSIVPLETWRVQTGGGAWQGKVIGNWRRQDLQAADLTPCWRTEALKFLFWMLSVWHQYNIYDVCLCNCDCVVLWFALARHVAYFQFKFHVKFCVDWVFDVILLFQVQWVYPNPNLRVP